MVVLQDNLYQHPYLYLHLSTLVQPTMMAITPTFLH